MGSIIIGIIFVALIFGGLGFKEIEKTVKTRYGENKVKSVEWRVNKKQLISPIGLLIIAFGCFTMVPANN